jgi:hypothetical protein
MLQRRNYGNLASIVAKLIMLRRISLRGGMNWKNPKIKPQGTIGRSQCLLFSTR